MTESRETQVENFQLWVRKSREAARKNPERYLGSYDFEMDETTVWMTQETYDALVRNCGIYNGTIPTGQYLGKIFIRRGQLMWFGIAKENALNKIAFNSRMILIRPVNGMGPAHPPTY